MTDGASTTTKTLAFSNALGDAHFVEDQLYVVSAPAAFVYYQELARRAAAYKAEPHLARVQKLTPDAAANEFKASLPSLLGTLLALDSGPRATLHAHLFNFALFRESLDGLVGLFFSGLVDAALAGDLKRVLLGLELWREITKRAPQLVGPFEAAVLDADHGELHFLTDIQIVQLIEDLPKIAKIKQKEFVSVPISGGLATPNEGTGTRGGVNISNPLDPNGGGIGDLAH